jgi:hypothetical protein
VAVASYCCCTHWIPHHQIIEQQCCRRRRRSIRLFVFTFELILLLLLIGFWYKRTRLKRERWPTPATRIETDGVVLNNSMLAASSTPLTDCCSDTVLPSSLLLLFFHGIVINTAAVALNIIIHKWRTGLRPYYWRSLSVYLVRLFPPHRYYTVINNTSLIAAAATLPQLWSRCRLECSGGSSSVIVF